MNFRIQILTLLSSSLLICNLIADAENKFYAPVPKGYEEMPYHLTVTKNTHRIKLNQEITEINYGSHITGVYDDMFGVKDDNGCWAFYSINGNGALGSYVQNAMAEVMKGYGGTTNIAQLTIKGTYGLGDVSINFTATVGITHFVLDAYTPPTVSI